MKLNLECGTNIRNGYENINFGVVPLNSISEGSRFVVGNYRNLDPIVDDGSCEEIVFNPPLNVLSPNEIVNVLNHWSRKLTGGGKLVVTFYDIRRIGRAAHSSELSLEDIHGMTLGNRNELKTVMDTAVIKLVASASGLLIESISPKQFTVTVELIKNAKD
jgi:hypothetical protein